MYFVVKLEFNIDMKIVESMIWKNVFSFIYLVSNLVVVEGKIEFMDYGVIGVWGNFKDVKSVGGDLRSSLI